MPIVITPYVNVADLAAVEKKVKAAGGQIHKSQQEVPGVVWFTLFSDPDGNIVGMWQPMPRRRAAPARKKIAKTSTARARPKKRAQAK